MVEIEKILKIIRKNWRRLLRIGNRAPSSDNMSFSDDAVAKYTENHRILQAIIAIVSNYREGIDVKNPDYSPRGIYKFEGGVSVDGKEIVIYRSDGIIKCYNDWNEDDIDTPKTVKKVIDEILSIDVPITKHTGSVLIDYGVKNTNVPEEIITEKVSRFAENPFAGDPLHRLFPF